MKSEQEIVERIDKYKQTLKNCQECNDEESVIAYRNYVLALLWVIDFWNN